MLRIKCLKMFRDELGRLKGWEEIMRLLFLPVLLKSTDRQRKLTSLSFEEIPDKGEVITVYRSIPVNTNISNSSVCVREVREG